MTSQPYINFFDLETTGTSPAKDRIVSISCIQTDFNLNVIKGKEKYLLINPQMEIPEESTLVHGITNEMVKDAPIFGQVAKSVYNHFDECSVIGGFNIIKFDIPLLYEEFARCNLDFQIILDKIKGMLDCYVIFRDYEPRDLKAALKFYCGLEFGIGEAHNAENDNIATINVLEGQMFRYGFNNIFEAIATSKSKKSENWIDFEGKIILNKEGIAIWNFGKYKDKNIAVSSDLQYCNWVLGQDFSTNTKNIISSIIS